MPVGRAVAHPAVLSLLSQGDPGTQPRRSVVDGTEIVAYSGTRVYMKRDAWEMLSPTGILVQWIRPSGATPWAIALTYTELMDVFGEVAESASWADIRCYHFPQVPLAARSFRVLGFGGAARGEATPAPNKVVRRASVRRPAAEVLDVAAAADLVLAHLRQHGSLSEEEVTRMAGGPRAYRKLRRHLQATGAPLLIEVTPSGAQWRLKREF